ncbi:hypothetical protein F9L16_09825 [Agarivorans sp. B2Z047]|uniref:hypothetical protein n=1 Tax=Agarivorans sp. B2Z047 TaxID=2652721 RepID=UPI00128D7DC3|nr:hypothetical protein [Agarivorans sp. B2Z047]MPW29297.1 hypothetical protein [Agarivorans sp. B2Z047]UQN41850.1 hypothetical protein LQZ07_19040 [Agarivorans sp. B2Z047]
MSHDLILVKLSDEQITQAKNENGKRTRPTHALLCGKYGQLVGTFKQLQSRYQIWKDYVGVLFDAAYESDSEHIKDLKSTHDIIGKMGVDLDNIRKSELYDYQKKIFNDYSHSDKSNVYVCDQKPTRSRLSFKKLAAWFLLGTIIILLIGELF